MTFDGYKQPSLGEKTQSAINTFLFRLRLAESNTTEKKVTSSFSTQPEFCHVTFPRHVTVNVNKIFIQLFIGILPFCKLPPAFSRRSQPRIMPQLTELQQIRDRISNPHAENIWSVILSTENRLSFWQSPKSAYILCISGSSPSFYSFI